MPKEQQRNWKQRKQLVDFCQETYPLVNFLWCYMESLFCLFQ